MDGKLFWSAQKILGGQEPGATIMGSPSTP